MRELDEMSISDFFEYDRGSTEANLAGASTKLGLDSKLCLTASQSQRRRVYLMQALFSFCNPQINAVFSSICRNKANFDI